MNKCIVLIVEGATEVEFYKSLIAHIRSRRRGIEFHTHVEYINVGGIGGFKNIALRKFQKQVKRKHEGDRFVIVLCGDKDVFEYAQRPPLDWDEMKGTFQEDSSVDKVISILAVHSIEDWFLLDEAGLKRYLRLSQNVSVHGKSGYDKIQKFFRQAGKTYIKGIKCEGLVDKLDMDKITTALKDELAPLIRELEEGNDR